MRPVKMLCAAAALFSMAACSNELKISNVEPPQGTYAGVEEVVIKGNGFQPGRGGVTVKFGIHPVAGRMPGHMNVLLAEANVPYSLLYEMDQINPDLPQTDVAVVIGANDVVNPDARDNPKSPIAGMPIIEVDRAKSVVVLKRGKGKGFSGLENRCSSSR